MRSHVFAVDTQGVSVRAARLFEIASVSVEVSQHEVDVCILGTLGNGLLEPRCGIYSPVGGLIEFGELNQSPREARVESDGLFVGVDGVRPPSQLVEDPPTVKMKFRMFRLAFQGDADRAQKNGEQRLLYVVKPNRKKRVDEIRVLFDHP